MAIEIENEEAFFLCLALGTLTAIRSGIWPPDAGIWSLALPAFRESIEPMNLNKEILDIFEGADELSAIEKLLGRQVLDQQIDTWIQTISSRLSELRVKSWSARKQQEGCSTPA